MQATTVNDTTKLIQLRLALYHVHDSLTHKEAGQKGEGKWFVGCGKPIALIDSLIDALRETESENIKSGKSFDAREVFLNTVLKVAEKNHNGGNNVSTAVMLMNAILENMDFYFSVVSTGIFDSAYVASVFVYAKESFASAAQQDPESLLRSGPENATKWCEPV